MLTKRISSNIYFPRAWLSFVKLKADWLLSSQNRMVEFGKHFTYLLARSSLDHATVEEALEHISVCRDKLGVQNGNSTTPKPKESPKGPHIRKSAAGCQVCGLAVLGPRLLLCSNEVSPLRRTPSLSVADLRNRNVGSVCITRTASAKTPKRTLKPPTGSATNASASRNSSLGRLVQNEAELEREVEHKRRAGTYLFLCEADAFAWAWAWRHLMGGVDRTG